MKPLLALTIMNIKAWVRSRGYAATVAAGITLVAVALLANELTGTEAWRVLTDVGLYFITLTTAATAGMSVLLALTSRSSTAQLLVLATRPIPRSALLLSRLLSAVFVILLTTVLLSTALAVVGMAVGVPAPWRIPAAALVAAFEGVVVVALAGFFGAGSSRAVASVMTIMAWGILRLGPAMIDLRTKAAPLAAYLPRLDRYSLAAWVHDGSAPVDLGYRVLVGVVFTVFLVAAAVWRFEERDLA